MQSKHITSSQQSIDAFVEVEDEEFIYDYPNNSNLLE